MDSDRLEKPAYKIWNKQSKIMWQLLHDYVQSNKRHILNYTLTLKIMHI